MPHAGAVLLTDPALLRSGRGKFLHELQAISQADLSQGHAVAWVNILNTGHARLAAALLTGEDVWLASSARTASVSAPSTGTLRPSPRLLPFHSTGSAGTRKGLPFALVLLTSPPGRSTWGS